MIVNICGIPHDVVECDDNFDVDCHMGMIDHKNAVILQLNMLIIFMCSFMFILLIPD